MELNPVRADMVRNPVDYPWSSYHCNASGESNTPITLHDCWLQPGKDDQERTAAYRKWIDERMMLADLNHIRQCSDSELPTGNDRFRVEIECTLAIRPGNGRRCRPRKTSD